MIRKDTLLKIMDVLERAYAHRNLGVAEAHVPIFLMGLDAKSALFLLKNDLISSAVETDYMKEAA